MLREIEIEYNSKKNFKVLKYEDIVENPKQEVERLFKWLQLDYSPDLLDFSKNRSFEGKYGDPKGVYSDRKPVKEKSEALDESLKDRRKGDLLNGYGFFLGKDFFKTYGYEHDQNYQNNLKFKMFRCV